MAMKQEEYSVSGQILQLVVNDGEMDLSTLLKLYVIVKAVDVEGLEEYILDYLEESGFMDRITALENGETGSLEQNFNEMNFGSLDGISVVRGIWDETNQRVSC